MRTNIYIRKENEKAWLKVTDKSAFVNRAIRNIGGFTMLGGKNDTVTISASTPIGKNGSKA